MITWAERAKAAISQTGQTGTAKTDEIPAFGVLAVSAVPTWAQFPASDQLVSVLAVPMPTVIEKTVFMATGLAGATLDRPACFIRADSGVSGQPLRRAI